MAITQAVCNSFKVEILKGLHDFTATTGNAFKLALYDNEATLSKSTTAFQQTDEVGASGTYAEGGGALTSVTPTLSSDTAVCDFNDVSYTSASFTANGAVIYNDSASGDPACAVIAFGGDKTVSSGTFTIQFPTADATNAIIRLA